MGLYIFTPNDRGNKYQLKNKIKVCRVEKDMTQEDLGKLVGTTRQTISNIEKGSQCPTLTLAVKIACVFEKEIHEIFYYDSK